MIRVAIVAVAHVPAVPRLALVQLSRRRPHNQDRAYWFNPFITEGHVPGLVRRGPVLFPLLLSLRRYEVVRLCLLGAAICFGLGIVGVYR